MFDPISDCFKTIQEALWARRTLPTNQTCHVGTVPVERFCCASALDRQLLERYVVRQEGILGFRGDRREPEGIFKKGFSFEATTQDFAQLYCMSRNDMPTAGCCVASLAALAYFPTCCCGLAPYLLTVQCGCILCSYFNPNYARCSPAKLCAMNMATAAGESSASVLSFSKSGGNADPLSKGLRYPMGIISEQPLPQRPGFLYLCYVPAPYVDFDKFTTKSFGGKGKVPPVKDDGEFFPLGAPTLSPEYVVGVWQLKPENGQMRDNLATFVKARTMLTVNHQVEKNSFKFNPNSAFVKQNSEVRRNNIELTREDYRKINEFYVNLLKSRP